MPIAGRMINNNRQASTNDDDDYDDEEDRERERTTRNRIFPSKSEQEMNGEIWKERYRELRFVVFLADSTRAEESRVFHSLTPLLAPCICVLLAFNCTKFQQQKQQERRQWRRRKLGLRTLIKITRWMEGRQAGWLGVETDIVLLLHSWCMAFLFTRLFLAKSWISIFLLFNSSELAAH